MNRRLEAAWTNTCDQVVLCSNDSDLEGALAMIRRHHPAMRIGLIAPIPGDDHRRIAADLAQYADWKKILSPLHLANAQLPQRIPNSRLQKSESW